MKMDEKPTHLRIGEDDRVNVKKIHVSLRFNPMHGHMDYDNVSYRPKIELKEKNTVSVHSIKDGEKMRSLYKFDKVHDIDSTQEEVYDDTVAKIVKGFLSSSGEFTNGCLLAFGQSGTGKSHTLMGHSESSDGIVHLLVEDLFQIIRDANYDQQSSYLKVKCSFLEIYQDSLTDLLQGPNSSKRLSLREDASSGVFVEGLLWKTCENEEDVFRFVNKMLDVRKIGKTNNNAASSRSHVVVTLKVERLRDSSLNAEMLDHGLIHIVDLAGSEKANQSKASGKTLEEAKAINKSLSALGNVILALASKKSQHIPWRDSNLTRLLQGSMGQDGNTSIILTASKLERNVQETIHTMQFGLRAKNITVDTSKNREDLVSGDDSSMKALDSSSVIEDRQGSLIGGVVIVEPSLSFEENDDKKHFWKDQHQSFTSEVLKGDLSFHPSMADSTILKDELLGSSFIEDFTEENFEKDIISRPLKDTKSSMNKDLDQNVMKNEEMWHSKDTFEIIGSQLFQESVVKKPSSFFLSAKNFVKSMLLIGGIILALMFSEEEEENADYALTEAQNLSHDEPFNFTTITIEDVTENDPIKQTLADFNVKIGKLDFILEHVKVIVILLFFMLNGILNTVFFAWNLFWYVATRMGQYFNRNAKKKDCKKEDECFSPSSSAFKRKRKREMQMKYPRLMKYIDTANIILSAYTTYAVTKDGFVVEVKRSGRIAAMSPVKKY